MDEQVHPESLWQSESMMERLKKRFVEGGLSNALDRNPYSHKPKGHQAGRRF
jgi:hypothetical protein